MSENGGKIAQAVKSEFALGLQRILVIAGLPILLGVGGFLGVRAVTTVDKIGERIDTQNEKAQQKLDGLQKSLLDQASAITVLQNTMTLRGTQRDGEIREINAKVSDHETRIRVLERPAGLSGPR